MSKPVIVTGAAGFIGHSVAHRLLDRGERVIGVDIVNDYYDPALKAARLAYLRDRHGAAFTFAKLDFADTPALDAAVAGLDIDRIVHLGAQAGVRYSIENPMAYARANLVGHLNILELARARQVRQGGCGRDFCRRLDLEPVPRLFRRRDIDPGFEPPAEQAGRLGVGQGVMLQRVGHSRATIGQG